MKIVTLKLIITPEIFAATKQFMEEKGLNLETELGVEVDKFYKKYVPTDVRKYIERSMNKTARPSSSKVEESTESTDNHPESANFGD